MSSYSAQNGNLLLVNDAGTVSIGSGALGALTLTSGSYNTCIGNLSGSSITTGLLNTIIGNSGNVSATTGRATVIGSGASLPVASATTLSVALGYGASSSNIGVCAIGAAADHVSVIEYGPHIGVHMNQTVWEGLGSYSGANVVVSALQCFDGMITFYHTGTAGTTSHTCTFPSASTVVAAIPDCAIGTAFYVKVGVYNSSSTSVKLAISFPSGWTRMGAVTIPSGTFANGCINFLCIVTNEASPAISLFSTGG